MSYVSDLRVVLRGRNFRRLFATRLVSQFSDGIFQLAVGGYAFFSPERQASATAIAAGLAVLLLPYSILGPFVGVFIDRWSRRQILVIAPIVRGLLLVLAACFVAAGAPDGVFYLAALGVLAVNRFFLSALSAALPHVVPAEHLMMANAVTPTSGTVATFVGAGAGVVLRMVAGSDDNGVAVLLVCSGVIFGLSSLIARTLERSLLGPAYDPDRPQAREAVRRVLTGLVDGARHIAHRRSAAAALGSIATHRLMFGISTATVVMLYRYSFTTDADDALQGIALVLGAVGAGSFAAVLVTPWATGRFRIETWVPAMLVTCGVLEFALCATFREWAFVLAGLVIGVAGQSVKICADTVVQRDIEDAYLGRAFSVYDMLFNGMTVLGAVLAAVLLPPDGRSYAALAVIGAGYLLGALGYRMLLPAGVRRPPVPAAD
ncbi:MFS transporter [Microbispora rosea subsp. aerata]|nr:MFS transporter [Microbispora rosea]GGO25219.1 MFS transporter [Microbispora rosea subsp. aerata]GIH58155.1 MFS transporter [Microbispora rosea subsp. aerata]GLJ85243.1 MFS transporter [Microbispora rosea subsp. aerata]